MKETKKKRLLIFHTKVAPYRVDFFNKLAMHYDMFICMDRKFVYGGLYQDIEKSYRFNHVEGSMSKNLWSAYFSVSKFIKEKQPDIVFVSECGLLSLMVVLYRFIHNKHYKIVSIIDDSYDQITQDRQFSRRHVIAEKVLIPFFDQIINVEERVSLHFQSIFGKGISFPIIRDEDIFRGSLIECLPICKDYIKKYGLVNKKVILFVGRFVALKNIPALINAYSKLKSNDVSLVLVGSGEEEDNLKALDKQHKVIFTGPLSGDALYAWYNIADIFVLPSTKEPFGAVTNEALMAGCKCLISERAGSSCLIKKNFNGDCFNPLDEEELYNKLRIMLESCNSHDKSQNIKPSLMPITFNQEISKVINAIDSF